MKTRSVDEFKSITVNVDVDFVLKTGVNVEECCRKNHSSKNFVFVAESETLGQKSNRPKNDANNAIIRRHKGNPPEEWKKGVHR